MKKLLLLTLFLSHFAVFAHLDKREGKLDENGLETGEWKTYHTNGKLASTIHLENDNLIDYQYYDKQGKLIKSGNSLN